MQALCSIFNSAYHANNYVIIFDHRYYYIYDLMQAYESDVKFFIKS